MENMNSADVMDPTELQRIREQTDWQALFLGLGLVKDDSRSTDTDWWAISPFEAKARPSFHLNDQRLWYDFGLKKGGGVIELVQQLQGVDCYEAGRIILDNDWLKPADNNTDEPAIPIDFRENHPIRQNLCPALAKQGTHEVFERRGISEETCQTLGIGYLPTGKGILKDSIVFQVRGVKQDRGTSELISTTLTHIGWKPNTDHTNPWILYETFDPTLELYNIDQLLLNPEAKAQVTETGKALLVSDPWDVAKCWEAGIYNVFTPLNKRLSEEQIQKLKQIQDITESQSFLVLLQRTTEQQRVQNQLIQQLHKNNFSGSGFEWNKALGKNSDSSPIRIQETIQSAGDMSVKQLQWLRKKRVI